MVYLLLVCVESLSTERKAAIERMQAKLRKLDKRRAGSDSDDSDEDDGDDERERKRKRAGPSSLDQELAKYANARRGNRKGVRKDEDDVMAALSSFTSKIRKSGPETDEQDEEGQSGQHGESTADVVAEEQGLEVDDDVGWMSHALKAVNDHSLDQNRRAETDYTVSVSCMTISRLSSLERSLCLSAGYRSACQGQGVEGGQSPS